jgi:AAHS family 3-hydroxyphenylpropionic acid transporter
MSTNDNVLRSTIILCVLAALCEGVDLQAAGVAASGIAPEFKPTPGQLGTFFSASTFGLLFGALVGGRLADSVGRKAVLVASIGLFGVCSLLTALAWNMPSLAWARLLTGLGLGGALPNLIALVSESAPNNRHNASVAMVYGATPLGGAVASLISLLSAPLHWRWIFIVGGVLPLLLTPMMALSLQESAAFTRIRIIAVRTGNPDFLAMPRRGSFIAIFGDGRGLRTLLLWMSLLLGLLTLYLLLNWLPTLMVGAGLTRAQASVAQIGFNVGGALAALLMGHLLEGRWRMLSLAVTFAALPVLILMLGKAPAQVSVIVPLVCALGCAILAAQAFLYAMAPAIYPMSIRGIGVGAAVAVGRIGSVVGPKLGGTLRAAGHSSAQLFLDILPIVIVGSICALMLASYSPKASRALSD